MALAMVAVLEILGLVLAALAIVGVPVAAALLVWGFIDTREEPVAEPVTLLTAEQLRAGVATQFSSSRLSA